MFVRLLSSSRVVVGAAAPPPRFGHHPPERKRHGRRRRRRGGSRRNRNGRRATTLPPLEEPEPFARSKATVASETPLTTTTRSLVRGAGRGGVGRGALIARHRCRAHADGNVFRAAPRRGVVARGASPTTDGRRPASLSRITKDGSSDVSVGIDGCDRLPQAHDSLRAAAASELGALERAASETTAAAAIVRRSANAVRLRPRASRLAD